MLLRRSATWSIARRIADFASRSLEAGPSASSAATACSVPAQVRKSLAVKSSPVMLAQIVVHVSRPDRHPLALVVHVLEQLLRRAPPGSARTMRASRRSLSATRCVLPLLPRNSKRIVDPEISTWWSRKVVSPNERLFSRVLLVADADTGALEQTDDGGEHLLSRQAGLREVVLDPLPDAWQRLAEGDHAAELGLVPDLAPLGMVAVLLPAPRVAPVAWRWPLGVGQIHTSVYAGGIARLLMRASAAASRSGRPSADTYANPRPGSPAANPGRRIAHVPQARGVRGLEWIGRRRRLPSARTHGFDSGARRVIGPARGAR